MLCNAVSETLRVAITVSNNAMVCCTMNSTKLPLSFKKCVQFKKPLTIRFFFSPPRVVIVMHFNKINRNLPESTNKLIS